MTLYWHSDPPPDEPVASGPVPVELELFLAQGLETTPAHLGEGLRFGSDARMLCHGAAIAPGALPEVAVPAAELVRAYDEHHGRIVLRRAEG